MQSIASVSLSRPLLRDVDYGRRFRQLRKLRWKGTVLALAKRLGLGYPTSVYNIERAWRVPMLPTLAKHAEALGCAPWELLDDVETEYDRVRALARLPSDQAEDRWGKLLTRYAKTTERGSGKRTRAGIYPIVVAKKAPPKGGKSKRAG